MTNICKKEKETLQKEKTKKKGKFRPLLHMIVLAVFGMVLGLLVGKFTHREEGSALSAFTAFLILCSAVFLQVIIHEGGHLVCGLLSGYSFLSFRIGSLILVKKPEGLRLKRYSLAGTGGQCLLDPPEPREGFIPVMLYNLGGPLANLLTAILFFLLWMFLPMAWAGKTLCFCLALIGGALGLMNGIPMHMGPIDNDGMNAISVSRSLRANRALRLQLKINAELTRGIRLRDMPDDWFRIPDSDDLHNPLIAALAVYGEARLMEQGRLQEAKDTCIRLLEPDMGLLELYRQGITLDLICSQLLLGEKPEKIDKLLSRSLEQFMKQMKGDLSVIRTRYLLALLRDRKPEAAEKIREEFERRVKTYPTEGNILLEQEIMALAHGNL